MDTRGVHHLRLAVADPDKIIPAVLAFLSITGCLRGGFSLLDDEYFSSVPVMVEVEGGYDMVWRYGQAGFFFSPDCRVESEALACVLQATSSSGNLSGREGRLEIRDDERIRAIREHGAYWVEPDDSLVRLRVVGA